MLQRVTLCGGGGEEAAGSGGDGGAMSIQTTAGHHNRLVGFAVACRQLGESGHQRRLHVRTTCDRQS